MEDLNRNILISLRSLMAHILEPKLDLDEFLAHVAFSAKELDPAHLEARVYEVDFIENLLYLRTSTQVEVHSLSPSEKVFTITPQTITGDATIENRVIVASRQDGYHRSRFIDGQAVRAAFPIEFFDVEMPEGRTKYLLVVDKKGADELSSDIVDSLHDFSVLAGLAISIKELRDKLSRYYEENRNLVLTGRHSASIGHDIRSLNIGVGGYLTLAMRYLSKAPKKDPFAKAGKYLELAQDNAGQIEALLRNFAQFNRTGIVLNRDADLRDAVYGKLDSLMNRADFGKQLKITMSLPEEKTGILVDPDWFGTVLENLVKNSAEACTGSAEVTVTVQNLPDSVLVVFEDNCGGISESMLNDLFTPFKTSKKKGQGLGLANAKKVVEDHGGVMSVASRPGHGVVFKIEFSKRWLDATIM